MIALYFFKEGFNQRFVQDAANPTAGPTFLMLAKPATAVFRPDIEGLRAIAILLVVAYHAGFPGFRGGFIGVDVFFVLSGYLITGLLVREVERTGTLDLPRFYARRARRLLPAMTLTLLVTMIVSVPIYSPAEQRGFTTTAMSTAAYTSNLYFAVSATRYGGDTADENPLVHTWSLSVEEQFYFVWPLFVMFAIGVLAWRKHANASRRRLMAWMAVVASVSFALSYYLTGVRQPWAFFSSPTRAWEFALGAIVVLLPQTGDEPHRSPLLRYTRQFLGWAALGGILVADLVFDNSTLFPGIAVLLPAIATVVVLRAASSSADNLIVRTLSLRPLQEIGRLSYSWYLWHWPVIVLGAAIVAEPSFLMRSSLVVLSLVLAAASYKFVENPIRESRWLASRHRYSLAMAGCLLILGIGLSFAWRMASVSWASGTPTQIRTALARDDSPHEFHDRQCMADYYVVNANPCAFGTEDSSATTVVLIGDSHAVQWFPAVRSIAGRKDWRLVTMTKSACVLTNAPFFYAGLGRLYNECGEWRKNAIEEIRRIRPALTIMASSAYYDFEDTDWRDGISSVVKDIAESSHSVLILRDTPRPEFNVPTCLARKEWRPFFIPSQPCQFPLEDPLISKVYAFQKLAARQHGNVLAADVSSSLCPNGTCVGELGETILYQDSNHITASAAMSLEGVLREQVDKAMAGAHTEPDATPQVKR